MKRTPDNWKPAVGVGILLTLGAIGLNKIPKTGEAGPLMTTTEAVEPQKNEFTTSEVRHTELKDGVITDFIDSGDGNIIVNKRFCEGYNFVQILKNGEVFYSMPAGGDDVCGDKTITTEDNFGPYEGLNLYTIADNQINPHS